MAAGLHISLSAEPVYYIGNFAITNSMLTGAIVSAALILFAIVVNVTLDTKTTKPKGLQNFAELVVESFYNFCNMITQDSKKSKLFLPFIATFFLFIMFNNWTGLIPGVGTIMVPIPESPEHANVIVPEVSAQEAEVITTQHGEEVVTQVAEEHSAEESEEGHAKTTALFRAQTADLNTTIALGLITIFLTQVFGFKYLKLGYLKKYFNFSSPIMFFVGILELVSEFAKIISFAFRLFGNVFAGEVLIAVLLYLTKVIIPIPFYGLELFVGMMQALVFSMLSLVFYTMATQSHDEHAH